MNVDRLVEQAREVSSGHGQWDTGGANYVRSLLAGLADAVEEHTDCVPADKVVIHSDLDGRLHVSTLVRERNEARARVAALEAAAWPLVRHVGEDQDGEWDAAEERLWALLSVDVLLPGECP